MRLSTGARRCTPPEANVTATTEASLFVQRNFAGLWWGQVFSITGDRLTYLALMGLLLQHSADGASYAALLALLGNVVIAPVLLFAPFTGAWVDRLPLKPVLVTSDVLRALIVLAVPVVYSTSNDVVWILGLVFALFTINVVFVPAKSALIPEIVAQHDLLAANSYLAGAGILATAIGALAGGWVVDRWGWETAMRLDAVTYLLSVIGLLLIRHQRAVTKDGPPAQKSATRNVSSYAREVIDGWTLLRRNTSITTALIALAAVWWAGGFLHVAGNDHIQSAASVPGMLRVGILLFAIGIGTAIGTWWINGRGRHHAPGPVLGAGLMLAGLAVGLFAATPLFAVFLLAAVLIGLFAAPALILTETLMQAATDPGQRGRVFSAKDFLMRLTLLASMSASAWLAAATGARLTLGICGFILLTTGALIVRQTRSAILTTR